MIFFSRCPLWSQCVCWIRQMKPETSSFCLSVVMTQMTPKYRHFASLIVLRGSKIFVKRRRNMVLLCVEDSSSSRQNVKCHTLFSWKITSNCVKEILGTHYIERLFSRVREIMQPTSQPRQLGSSRVKTALLWSKQNFWRGNSNIKRIFWFWQCTTRYDISILI